MICLLSISRLSFAQNATHKINLDQYVEDEKSVKMRSVIPIYSYTGQPFEDPINNGVETKNKFGHFYAKLPDMTGIRDTSYGYIFYGGIPDKKDLPGYVLIVLGKNMRQINQSALMWVDRNYNLDMTDDGPPDTLYHNKTLNDIVLHHPNNYAATYTISISRLPAGSIPPYLSMMADYFKENSGSKKFVNIIYSLGEVRMNTIGGNFKHGNDSFKIGIKDLNCNGYYNDAEKDYLLVGEYGAEIMPDNRIVISKNGKPVYFERNGKRFNVTKIDPLGRFIEIQIDTTAPLKHSLVVGKKIKKFKYLKIGDKNKKVSIKKNRRKPTYIYVWHLGQNGFKEDTAILREIALKYGNKINLVTLNYGENPKELRAFQRRNRINWSIGQSTRIINDQLFLESFPLGILTAKRLKIKQVRISPKELLILLQNNLI